MVDPAMRDEMFSSDAQLQIFHIVQEALSNARKHGQACNVLVAFAREDGLACATIQDDGHGFVPEDVTLTGRQHFGLQFMRERAEQLGGLLRVQSEPGKGTRVVLEIPIKEL
jgi:two-component system nitrate/nitrite sensor histidine kinase NarX